MTVLVISDIHANITALEAVLDDAGPVEEVWCLGDLVGYGPDPNECIDRLRDLPNLTCLPGNHDVAVLGGIPLLAFNGEARKSLEWQRGQLSPSNLEFLSSLPMDVLVRGEASLVHGSPRDSVWEYVINTIVARINFDHFKTPWCFIGHSHVVSMFRYFEEDDRVSLEIPAVGTPIVLDLRAILNPGSVGQPRDRDPRAAYALYEPEAHTWEARRARYDVKAVQARIREYGLPERHAARLEEGW